MDKNYREKVKGFPFEIIGKLSATPEQAKKMFGFEMKKGAIGIIFQRKSNGESYIRNSMPRHHFTEKEKINMKKMSVISRIASEHLKDLIHTVWNPIANNNSCGFNTFMSKNFVRVGGPPKWENLIITDGNAKLPKIEWISRWRKQIKIKIKCPQSIGMGALNGKDFKLYHYPAKLYQKGEIVFKINHSLYNPIFFIYSKEKNCYSKSISIKLKEPGRRNYGYLS